VPDTCARLSILGLLESVEQPLQSSSPPAALAAVLSSLVRKLLQASVFWKDLAEDYTISWLFGVNPAPLA
jgi:hypothetical protein